jgi:hypothetical protein
MGSRPLLSVDQTHRHSSRLGFFQPLLMGKKVLHVGFVDWPKKISADKTLHLVIAPWCARLDGIDANVEQAEKLRVPNGDIFSDWDQVPNDYDVILVPEVIEHVDNVADFFGTLNNYTGMLIVTAPDAYLLQKNFEETADGFSELVHADHNCWYSPYTLKNTINKFSNKKVSSLYWLDNSSIAAICV